MWATASFYLARLLDFLHSMTGSYGLAIILLTVLARLLIYPLSQKQLSSMAAMQRIQPQMKVLQEKYKNNKELLNAEVMRLYRENRVNPMAGCLPLLIQLPIMILLFQTLRNVEYVHSDPTFAGLTLNATFLQRMGQALSLVAEPGTELGLTDVMNGVMANPGGLANLGIYLPTLIFIIAVAFLTWLQQRLSGSANNPQMATMNIVMPIFMVFICLSMPGGVLLYWGTSTLIGIAQQWFIVRRTKAKMAEKPALYKSKPTAGKEAEEFVPAVPREQKPSTARSSDDEDDEYDDEYDDDEYEDDDEYYDDDEYEDEYEDEEDEADGKKDDKKKGSGR